MLAVLVAALVAVAVSGGTSARGSAAATVVSVDLRVRYQTMQGFGASERVWTDPHMSNSSRTVVPLTAQREILRSVFTRLGLTRLRPVIESGIAPVPFTDPKALDPATLDFSGRHLDAHAALVRQAKPYGLKTFFPSPVTLEPWLTESNPDAYVAIALAELKRWRQLGEEPPYFSPINEPGYWRGGNRSPEWLARVVAGLGPQMRAAGLKTRLVIPDDINATEAYKRASVVLADPSARPYVGALAYHLYGGQASDIVRMRDLARRYGLPIWMTEYTDPAYTSWPGALGWSERMQDVIVRGNASAVDYFWAFSGDVPGAMAAITFDNGVYRSFALRPVYFITGQFSRFVKPGYRRVAATPVAGTVLTSAFRSPKGKLVVVAVNTGTAPQPIRFSIAGGRLSSPVTAVRTSSTESWRSLGRMQRKRSAFNAVLSPQSVTTFVGQTAR